MDVGANVTNDKPVVRDGGSWGAAPKEVAALAVSNAGYRDFRHLAKAYVEGGYNLKPPAEAGRALNISPDVLETLLSLDEFLQEVSWAVVFQYAGRPEVMAQVIGRLVNIATEGEDENSLAAHRIYISLLARMGIFPKNEVTKPALGVQINILSNHPKQEEVVVIGEESPQDRRLQQGGEYTSDVPF